MDLSSLVFMFAHRMLACSYAAACQNHLQISHSEEGQDERDRKAIVLPRSLAALGHIFMSEQPAIPTAQVLRFHFPMPLQLPCYTLWCLPTKSVSLPALELPGIKGSREGYATVHENLPHMQPCTILQLLAKASMPVLMWSSVVHCHSVPWYCLAPCEQTCACSVWNSVDLELNRALPLWTAAMLATHAMKNAEGQTMMYCIRYTRGACQQSSGTK